MAVTAYDIGDVARLTFAVTVAGVPADPTTVVLTVDQPDATETVYSGGQVVKDTVGNYHCDVPVVMAGQVKYRWTGSGSNATVEENSFLVRQRGPAPPFGPIAPSGTYEPAGSVANEALLRTNADALEVTNRIAAISNLIGTLVAVANRETKHVFAYGALGDGVNDDTLAIQAAFATGKPIEFKAGATYLYSGQLPVATAGQDIYGHGATLKRAPQVHTTTTSAIVSGATYSIIVASTTGLAVGKEIVLEKAGVYDTSSRVITSIVGSVVTVSTSFGMTSASGTVQVYTSHYGVFVTAAGCRILGLNFDGNKANYTLARWENTVELEVSGVDRALIMGCYFNNAPGEAMVALGNYISVLDNVVTNSGGNGVHFGTSTHVLVDGNRFVNCNLDITVGHQDGCIIWSNSIAHATVTNNYCENGISGIASIDSVDNSDVTIIGNTIKSCTTTAIEGICPNGSEVGDIVISGNRIYDSVSVTFSQVSGASAVFPNHVIFSGNYLKNTFIAITRARWVIVANNIIEDAGDTTTEEIYIFASKHITVRGNLVVGGNMGVSVYDALSENVLVDGNVLVNQYLRGVSFGDADMVNVAASNNAISNDATSSASYDGIIVRGKEVARGNNINIVNGHAGIYPQNYAIVKDNTIRSGGATNSIKADGATTNIIIKNNEVTTAVADGGTNTVSDNVIVP